MVARSTDGHKTNASLGAEHLAGDGEDAMSFDFFSVRFPSFGFGF